MSSSGNVGRAPRPNPNDPKVIDKKLREVGTLYEKQFLREMVKQMRSSVPEGGFLPTNMGEKIFREQLDHEYIEGWGDRGGIGIADLVYQQLIDKFGARMGIRPHQQKPTGPLPLTEKNNYIPKIVVDRDKEMQINFERKQTDSQNLSVSAPWGGKVLGSYQLADGQNLVDLEHAGGVRSQIVYRGQPSLLQVGDELNAGQKLGYLSAESNTVFWKIRQTPL